WRVAGQSALLHAWVGGGGTCYAVEPHRQAGAPEAVLGPGRAGEVAHGGVSAGGRVTQGPHPHLPGHGRPPPAQAAARRGRGAVHYPRRLIALFTEAIHLRNRHLAGEVSAQELKESRKGFDERLERLAWPAREVPAYETLSEHLWKHLDEWFMFLEDPAVEP